MVVAVDGSVDVSLDSGAVDSGDSGAVDPGDDCADDCAELEPVGSVTSVDEPAELDPPGLGSD